MNVELQSTDILSLFDHLLKSTPNKPTRVTATDRNKNVTRQMRRLKF